MKKLLIIITVIFGLTVCYSQEHPFKFTTENFENQILSYNPNKNQNVSDKDYRYGTMILEETRNAVKNKPENFNLADYFNVLNAFLSLKETKENIDLAFRKFVNTTGSCEYILSFENSIKIIQSTILYEAITTNSYFNANPIILLKNLIYHNTAGLIT